MIEWNIGEKYLRSDGAVGIYTGRNKPEHYVKFADSNVYRDLVYTYDVMGECLDCVKELKNQYRIVGPAPTKEDMQIETPKTVTVADLKPSELKMYNKLGGEEQKRVFLERQATYGSVVLSHQQIGRMWAAKLSNYLGQNIPDLPGYLVALMMVDMKTQRASRVYHNDNYVDGQNYLEFANIMQEDGQ